MKSCAHRLPVVASLAAVAALAWRALDPAGFLGPEAE